MNQSDHPSPSQNDDGRYRLLIESVTDYAIYMLDPSGIVTSWNPGAQRFKGYTADEIVGQHFSRFYTEEDRAGGLPDRVLETARTAGKFESEGWRVRKDGSRFWAYVVLDPIRKADGTLIGYAKITRDLTERRAAEEALRRSQEQFRLLVQGVTDYAIYLLDTEGRVTNWNLGAQRIKGYSPEEAIGGHFSRFYTDEDRASGEPSKALAAVAREGRFEREGWRVRKDGTRFWAHVIIDAIRDDDDKLIGYAKITRDVTERKEAQEKLERAQEVLFQSQKLEAIGQLTGGIAHDFNNLLMAILGSLELMRKRLPDDPKLLALLENAVQGGQRGAALTKRMLAFARRQELKQETIDIPDLVRGMTDLLQRSLGPSIEIETRFPLAGHPIRGDANQLEMAILNLSVNARDAMPNGGRIIIATREESILEADGGGLEPGDYVCLSVTDFGAGMNEETLKRAMEPFFTTKGPGKGTGLGLPMVHGVIEQSGGRFLLKSRVGEGTTAELWLPAASGVAPAAATVQSAFARTNEDALTVLAVDDDPLVLTNTIAMLEDMGHTALGAASGAQALAILDKHPVDIVVTDQAMPSMTGLELAGTIAEKWPDIAVIIATGYAEMGPDARTELPVLAKPFTQAGLAYEISRAPVRASGTARIIRFPVSKAAD